MANFCPAPIGACLMEVIALDDCGLVVPGPNNALRTAGFISATFTPDVEAGVDILEYNACGDICVNEKGCPVFKGMNVTLRLCGVSPVVLNMLLDHTTPVLNGTDIIGLSFAPGKSCKNFQLKLFSPTRKCDAGGTLKAQAYGFPRLQNPVLSGEMSFAKDVVQHAEVTAYVNAGAATTVDPTNVFTAPEYQGKIWTQKGVTAIPAATECAFITLP